MGLLRTVGAPRPQIVEKVIQKQKEEIKLKEQLLEEARNESAQGLAKEKELKEQLLKRGDAASAKMVAELAQWFGDDCRRANRQSPSIGAMATTRPTVDLLERCCRKARIMGRRRQIR